MENNKIPHQINNIVGDNLKALVELFPSAVKDGLLDIEALKEELGQFEEVGAEKYELTWSGKQSAKKLAQEDVYNRTLKYVAEDSKNPTSTENLYIEGDNLEVLKLLRQNYYGSIKMIYIDPPYNTGNDFVYNDKFAMDKKSSDIAEGVTDEDGNPLQKNQQSSNRYHANWLNMMYPRLKIAKDLLTDDGVIFVHIDDNEVENIGKLCNEIFGEDNFINLLTVKTKIGGVSGSSEGKSLKDATEFIWIYAKNKSSVFFNPVYIQTPLFDRITAYESEGKSWKYTSVMTKLAGKTLIKEDKARGMKFYGYSQLETKSISAFARDKNITQKEVYNRYADKIFQTTNAQSSIRQTVIKETDCLDYPMFGLEYTPIKGKNADNVIEILYKGEQRRMMMFLSDSVTLIDGEYVYLDKINTLWDDIDYNNLTKEGNIEFANGKKPIKLLQRLLSLSTNEDSLVIDYFSGSGSTAHAVMQLNAEDGGKRKFIMVQYPEQVTKEENEATFNVLESIGKSKNICEIGKERIRRAGEKILADNKDKEGIENLDVGFKVFSTADTNIKWNAINSMNQEDLFEYADDCDRIDFIYGAKDIDIVYEVMLRQKDVPLSETMEVLSDIGERTYLYANSYLVCLETEITTELIEKLASLDPLPIKFVFRDTAFKDDISLKDETFRRLKTLVERNTGETKKTYTVEFI